MRISRGAVLLILAFIFLNIGTYAQTATWTDGNGDWTNPANWTPTGFPNSATTNVFITDGTSTVTLDTNASVANLQLASGNTLNIDSDAFLTINGPQILNDGQITATGDLGIAGNTVLSGTGTLTLAGFGLGGETSTLTNESTIQGSGLVQVGSITNTGLIDATSGGSLELVHLVGVTNTGTMEATNGSELLFFESSPIDNQNGTIEAIGAGSFVNFGNGTVIEGGTLTSTGGAFLHSDNLAVILDGSTQGALTLSTGTMYEGTGTTTHVLGTIINNGNMQLTGTDSILAVSGDTILQGTGTVTLAGSIQAAGGPYTLTNQSTIQGSGSIGVVGQLNLVNAAGGLIDANTSGEDLAISLTSALANTGGTMEATNGGELSFYVVGSPIDNENGTIEANGAGSRVLFFNGVDIQGGTLTTSAGGSMGTDLEIEFDGTTQGALTLSAGSTYTGDQGTILAVQGTIINNGNMQFTSGQGTGTTGLNPPNTSVILFNDTTLQGTGTLTLANDGSGAGVTFIEASGGNYTLTNESTIQGAGFISQFSGAGELSVINTGLIDADVSGETLAVNPTSLLNSGTLQVESGSTMSLGIGSGSVTNTGTFNVKPGGTMIFDITAGSGTLTNSGAINVTGSTLAINDGGNGNTVTLSGGGTVNLSGGTITGSSGDETLVNDSTIQGSGTVSNLSLINNGAINANGPGPLTISGPLTNNGMVNVTGPGGLVTSSIGNSGTITVNGSTLTVNGNYNLEMVGILQLKNGSTGLIEGGVTGGTDNSEQTILISNSSLHVIGNYGPNGTVVTQGTLFIQGSVGLPDTSPFILQGSSATVTGEFGLDYAGQLSLDSSSLTVLGGNYGGDHRSSTTLSNGSVLSVNGDIIVSAASTFNLNSGSLVVANGDFTDFNSSVAINNGTLNANGTFALESQSTVTVGTAGILKTTTYSQQSGLNVTDVSGTLIANSYQQSGGTTTIESGGLIDAGSFLATGGAVTVNGVLDPTAVEIDSGATLNGTGTIIGNVAMGGTVTPGSATAPGTLAIIGNYEQIESGVFDEVISDDSANGLLDVLGDVTLDRDSLLEITLLNGFDPLGDSFTIMDYSSLLGEFSNGSNFIADGYDWTINYGSHDAVLTAVASTPEPGTLPLLAIGVIALYFCSRRKKKIAAAR